VSIVGAGASGKAWNWPGTTWNRFADWEHYRRSAEVARSGILDAVFVSDHPALQRTANKGPSHLFDPIVLFSAIAGAIPDIGFVLTASTPLQLAVQPRPPARKPRLHLGWPGDLQRRRQLQPRHRRELSRRMNSGRAASSYSGTAARHRSLTLPQHATRLCALALPAPAPSP